MVSKNEIGVWFDHGVAQSCNWLVILTDTFNNETYAVYFSEESHAYRKAMNPGNLTRYEGSYDLKGDRQKQLDMYRCHAIKNIK